MKKILLLTFFAALLTQCKSDPQPKVEPVNVPAKASKFTPPSTSIPPINSVESDEELQRKINNLQPQNHTPTEPFEIKKVNLSAQLSPVMIAKGKKTFENNCKACHSLTNADGPKASGLRNVLNHRTPAWFMNMTTAVSMKLGKDNQEEKQLSKCPTRNYNTRLSFIDSRDFLELLLSLK